VLLMPSRFWAEPRGLIGGTDGSGRPIRRVPGWLAWRPPSSDQVVIYQNMLRVWSRLFLPAAGFTLAGIALMGLAVVRASELLSLVPWIVVALIIGAALVLYVRAMWPVLGVED
jgi:hypothetical protein